MWVCYLFSPWLTCYGAAWWRAVFFALIDPKTLPRRKTRARLRSPNPTQPSHPANSVACDVCKGFPCFFFFFFLHTNTYVRLSGYKTRFTREHDHGTQIPHTRSTVSCFVLCHLPRRCKVAILFRVAALLPLLLLSLFSIFPFTCFQVLAKPSGVVPVFWGVFRQRLSVISEVAFGRSVLPGGGVVAGSR